YLLYLLMTDTVLTKVYTLSLHDALPISGFLSVLPGYAPRQTHGCIDRHTPGHAPVRRNVSRGRVHGPLVHQVPGRAGRLPAVHAGTEPAGSLSFRRRGGAGSPDRGNVASICRGRPASRSAAQ